MSAEPPVRKPTGNPANSIKDSGARPRKGPDVRVQSALQAIKSCEPEAGHVWNSGAPDRLPVRSRGSLTYFGTMALLLGPLGTRPRP